MISINLRNFAKNNLRILKILKYHADLPADAVRQVYFPGYKSVTIMFTDFVGFSILSRSMTPKKIVMELDRYFKAFDEVAQKHNIEKIKTIGDAYMCAAGLPIENDTHPIDMINAAFEMIEVCERFKKSTPDGACFDIRIGIHTGPVAAGVVGIHKFSYDIWGDSVNISAGLERAGEPGKINISKSTYAQVKHVFDCTYRGKEHAKNIGDVDMYFVHNKRKAN